jgi:hypothetical protein
MTACLLSFRLSRRAALASSLSIAAVSVAGGFFAAQGIVTAAAAPEDTLREIEARRLHSLVDFDMEVADALHADDFQLINPAGGALSKQDYLGGLESGFLDYVIFEPVSEIIVRVYGDGAALRYQSEIEMHRSDGFVDQGQFWHTDVYERRDGQWQVVLSQATKIA